MSRKIIPCAIALVGFCLAVSLHAEDKDPLAGVKCPVSGKQVVKDGVADYKGGKVYFCCTNCPKGFAANTAKFAAKANHQLALTGQAEQVKCPIKGKPVNAAQHVSVAGVEVGFCCPGCKKKASSAEGDEQIKLIFNDAAFKKAYTVGDN